MARRATLSVARKGFIVDDSYTDPEVIQALYLYNLNVILSEADNQGNVNPVGALAAAGSQPISGQTLASGGGGGTGGGGGGGSFPGKCVELGIPVTFAKGSTVQEEILPQSDWIAVKVGDDEPVLMVPETLVAVWVMAKDLKGGELADVGDAGEVERIASAIVVKKRSRKVHRTVHPSHQYRARRLRVHNLKLAENNDF